jgi:hypothetical protein
MANSDVVASVSATLLARLNASLLSLGSPGAPPPTAVLDDLATKPANDPPRVTLFLYDIVEEATVRNRAKTAEQVGGQLLVRKQPLGLCLHYMITAWGGDRDTEQRMLGRVLQVLYDDAIVDGPELAGVLSGSASELRVSLSAMRLDDRARIWWAINLPYRLSINYEVRVVDIDPTRQTSTAPVRARALEVGVSS